MTNLKDLDSHTANMDEDNQGTILVFFSSAIQAAELKLSH